MSEIDYVDNPLTPLATKYLETLLRARREEASRLVMDAAASGTSVRSLYLHVLQPVQRQIGKLWQTNQVTVAHEHYCTAATQLVMGRLSPYLFAAPRNGRRAVVTCVGGELHEVGARMVADLLEMEGWDCYFLGANTPTGSIVSAVADRKAHLLAVSVTIHYNVEEAKRLIGEVRDSAEAAGLKVMVGGRPFLVAPGLWKTVEADAFAPDAAAAVDAAAALMN
jgi:MerR family transcriptional regulator, light-induced transcriptional regulator